MADIYFVYRSHYEGPLSKRVRKLSARSIATWFGQHLQRARKQAGVLEEVQRELGGYVYGLSSIFEAARSENLSADTGAELKRVLRKHLYVEGGPDHIRVDDHSARILTDDDEVKLAYFFFDDTALAAAPDRLAYLLHEEPRLPDGDADGGFTPPVPIAALEPRATGGDGTTYVCLLTFYDGDSFPGTLVQVPGVRLPQLAEYLRRTKPHVEQKTEHYRETWPIELRLLRAMLDEHDRGLGPAFERIAPYPLAAIGGDYTPDLGVGAHATARAEFRAAAEGKAPSGDPARSIIQVGEHVALFAMHATSSFGHQQWIVFDDRWAAAHPALASSVLRYTRNWDPFERKKPKTA
jgi:hypothetical protein